MVSTAEIANAKEVLKVEKELLSNTESKERFLQTLKKNMEEKIIGFKFGVDDRVADAKEAANNVKEVEEALAKLCLNIAKVEATVSAHDLHMLWDTLDKENDGFSLGLTKLGKFRFEQDVLIRKLDFANFSLEYTLRKARKAQDQYEDAGMNLWKFEADIEVVHRELQEVRRQRDVVSNQIRKMKHGGGVLCCPKPC
jgi:peptidoglycan hydrolase CwlO-like protein